MGEQCAVSVPKDTYYSATGWTKLLTCAITEGPRNILPNEEPNMEDRILEICSKLIFSSDIKNNFFWLHHAACGNIGIQPGIKPVPQHWKCRVWTTGPSGKSLGFHPHEILEKAKPWTESRSVAAWGCSWWRARGTRKLLSGAETFTFFTAGHTIAGIYWHPSVCTLKMREFYYT